jgi:pimeloyl-ACP methyl ester carboxylesterase
LIEWVGFLDPGRAEKHSGLVMLQPYQKGKIPVVFVHGLLSDPFTWTEMFNELGADPEIRNKYQFWAFFYATGSPFLRSASMLREDLQRVRQLCDPTGEDPALSQMVMVGHSMGGLLSQLQTTSGGDEFWHTISERPFDQIKTRNEEQRERFRKVFYFEQQEYIRRVVFLGTPHRGSAWSPATIGRLGSWLVRVPTMLLNFQRELVADNPGAFLTSFSRQFPTSVDMLAPDSPVLKVMYRQGEPRGVHYHSIVGNGVQMGREGQGDGVVPVSSAHMPNADSELLIPETHTMIHRHPRAVLEVKRILKLHAEAAGRQMQEGRVTPAIASPQDGPAVILPAR